MTAGPARDSEAIAPAYVLLVMQVVVSFGLDYWDSSLGRLKQSVCRSWGQMLCLKPVDRHYNVSHGTR